MLHCTTSSKCLNGGYKKKDKKQNVIKAFFSIAKRRSRVSKKFEGLNSYKSNFVSTKNNMLSRYKFSFEETGHIDELVL